MAPKARVQKRLYYKIGEACKALDIQPYVLRYWETEFPPLSPNKSRSGQRVYSEKELAIIRRIKELLYEEGYTIAGAKKKLDAELAGGTLGGADASEDEAQEPAATGKPAAATAPLDGEAILGIPPTPRVVPLASQGARATPPPLASEGAEPEPGQAPLLLDTRAAERIESMRKGLQQVLAEAREILALLDA